MSQDHIEQLLEAETQTVDSLKSQRGQRSLALHMLYVIDRSSSGCTVSEALEMFREGYDLEIGEDDFALKIVRGVTARHDELAILVSTLLENWTYDRLGCCTRLILKMALWELQKTDTPPQIIVNEAIELGKAFSEEDAHRLINGMLDRYCKAQGITYVPFESAKEEKEEEPE